MGVYHEQWVTIRTGDSRQVNFIMVDFRTGALITLDFRTVVRLVDFRTVKFRKVDCITVA